VSTHCQQQGAREPATEMPEMAAWRGPSKMRQNRAEKMEQDAAKETSSAFASIVRAPGIDRIHFSPARG
jgi:hypothetical protein